MRRQGVSPGDHWRFDGGRLPIVGDFVCVHPGGGNTYNYIARVIEYIDNKYEGYCRFRVQPLWSPRTSARDMHVNSLEPVLATFEGPICVLCKKGNIR